jgi:muramidase (phage lysozyme)
MLNKLKKWVENVESQKYTFQNGTYYAIKSGEEFQIIRLLYIENNSYFHYQKHPNVKTLENINEVLSTATGEYKFDTSWILENWKEINEISHKSLDENDFNSIVIQDQKKKKYRSKMEFFSNMKRDYTFMTDLDKNGNKIWKFWPNLMTINSGYLPLFFRYSSYAIYVGTVIFVGAVSKFSFPRINSVFDSATIYALLWLLYGLTILGIQIKYKMTYAIIRGFVVTYMEESKIAFYFIIFLNLLLILFMGFVILLLASFRNI